MRRYSIWTILFISGVLFIGFYSTQPQAKPAFHSAEELARFHAGGDRSPIDTGEYFLGSVNCRGCHGLDSTGFANVDPVEGDVNVYNDWESTMMALSAKDPFWRAKVSHEILVNPGHADLLQNKCTSCHAPMGHFTAMFKGHPTYTLEDLKNDTLGLDGVSCMGCHTIGTDSFGLGFSGHIFYDTTRRIFGPYQNPPVGPMQLYTGFTPTYSEHMHRSQVCASCHTLITEVADLNGAHTGETFVEQATYHEWLNSSFNNAQPCQSCHMPQIKGPVVIANGYINLPPRSPFNKHYFQGANLTMLELIKQNRERLQVSVSTASFDSTIAVTKMLLESAVQLDVQSLGYTTDMDSLIVKVTVRNKSGHKFPSGYPSRRAFISLLMTDEASGDTLFHSGRIQPDQEVFGNDLPYEPHHQWITADNQVQIYEMVMGDVNSNVTTVLERANTHLKDNRIPPTGFQTTHYTYDTVKIVGEAADDVDFNRSGSLQGTGSDIIYYRLPVNGLSGGSVQVKAAVHYQTMPPRYFTEMFSFHSPEIDTFRSMYDQADRSPVLISQKTLSGISVPTGIENTQGDNISLYPIPATEGKITVESPSPIQAIEVYDIEGKLLKQLRFHSNERKQTLFLPPTHQLYLIRILSNSRWQVRKVFR